MPKILIPSDTQQWLAPYGYALVGLILLAAIIHLILRYLQNRNDFLWYRQVANWRRLSLSRKRTLQEFSFYKKLSPKYQKQFEHRVACFIADKIFKHRYGKPVQDHQKVTIASIAVMLTFGRRNYMMDNLETILIFDTPFESAANQVLHKGEFNPRAKVLALSWPDVLAGIQVEDDNFHLALHEFTHVIHIESERSQHIDALRYHKYHHLLLMALKDREIRNRLEHSQFFRDYAFTNQYEFMAVLTEYFFESPVAFQSEFPLLFQYIQTALLYKTDWLTGLE
ncbi:zinc-dependent peptidase [Nonlabens sp. YIK11]|uniref:zinc-dependent peptidase n=1 Tax=Nonlabens sp. YIK11 TaxID=1453349 RepID=UPI0006DBD8D4|nr:zinc-dependent peptidase [Nonlabens sp. YIK11]